MKLATWLVLGGLGLGWLGACGKASSGEQVGGETHWLKHCSGMGDSEAECGPDLECVCGVCTAACDADSACGTFSSEGRCSRPSDTEFASACVSPVPERICVRAQSQAPDGSDGVLIEGLRYDVARNCLEPLAVAGTMETDVPCSGAVTYGFRGDECWQFPSSCLPDDFVVANVAVIDSLCFTARECLPAGSCAPDGSIPTVDGCLSCDVARDRIVQTVDDFVQAAGYDTCSHDADCVAQAWNTECWAGCFVPMAAVNAPNFQAELPGVTSGYCPTEWRTTCGGPPNLNCVVPTPICRAGTCVVSNEPPCADRPLETCDADGDCAVARAFPFNADQRCFAAAGVEVESCIDPDVSCPPDTTSALDGDGNCFLFGGCLPAGFVQAPAEHACTDAMTCAP